MVLKYPQGKTNGGLPTIFCVFNFISMYQGGTILACGFDDGEIDGFTTHPSLAEGRQFFV